MALLTDCELWFLRCDPARPNNKFDKENPTWEVQIRTTDKTQKKEWEALSLPMKAMVPDEGPPYFRVNLKKSSIKKDGTPAAPVKIVDGDLNEIDPNTIGNGSVGNIRIFQYDYPKKEGGGTGIATILMAIQITKHIEFERRPREDEFGKTTTTRVPLPDADPDAPEHGGEDDIPF
jgi:hypothetical protein